METANAKVLALLGNVLGGKHSSVRRCLVAIGLDLHAAGDLADGLTARGISDVHEGVVEGRVDVADGHDHLTLLGGQAKLQAGHLLGGGRSLFLRLLVSHVFFGVGMWATSLVGQTPPSFFL